MIKKYKPTSPGRRDQTTLIRAGKKANKKILKTLSHGLGGSLGRSHGKISVHHKKRGTKKKYRTIDFKRSKRNIEGKVISIDYDPFRTCDIALISYLDGDKRYILASEGLKEGSIVKSGDKVDIVEGYAMQLKNIPVGTFIHNIELYPGGGGKFVRSAGLSAQITAKEKGYVNVKMPSGEVRQFLDKCFATIGVLNNSAWNLVKIGKAGRKAHMGVRPTVRGKSKSAYDHPLGGSYRQKMGKQPVDRWGNKSKGKKTRKRMHTNKYIVKDRRQK